LRRILSYFELVVVTLAEWLLVDLPGPIGRRLRRVYWRIRLGSMGRGVQIDTGIHISNPSWVHLGDHCWLDHGAVILAGPPSAAGGRRIIRKANPEFKGAEGEVLIGDRVHIANHCVLQGHGGLQIGNDMTTASGSRLYSLSHHHSNPDDPDDHTQYKFSTMAPAREQSLISAAVVVGDGAAIGLNTVVLPGVTVGTGTWVGAGSVVTRSLPSNVLAAGHPAQVRRSPLNPNWVTEGTA
jgi:acetyltransferase-like isoleucine patch superfamily enzyme